jgi:ABC-2 type transport system ATP-binding protein
VEGLNLEIQPGAIFGFLGRNGAGKTTTIRMVTGLAQPTRGRAWVAGIETTSPDSQARRMFGYLPQNPSFYNWMTPLEYLNYCASLFELPHEHAKLRISEILKMVELDTAAKRKIGGFSGGMVQRLGIAQALIHSPPVLFLDEPTSSLDPAGRYEVLDLINRLRGSVTVFLSSHILADIERVCDTIAILRSGELVLTAGRDELLSRYIASSVEITLVEKAQFPEAFITTLKEQPWYQGVNVENSHLELKVKDVEVARKVILTLVVQHNLAVERFEWVRPTLEEIFLSLSA